MRENMDTNTIVFGDTHMGAHQNSLSWLQHQLNFFEKQFIPYLEQLKNQDTSKNINLIHLGDVYDIRTSLNGVIVEETKKLFKKLSGLCNQFLIISGNHDHYYNEKANPCNIDLTLSNISDNIKIFSDANIHVEFLDNKNEIGIFIPWFAMLEDSNLIHLQQLIQKFSSNKDSRIKVFCHTNLSDTTNPIIQWLSKQNHIEVYSGHMHNPVLSTSLPKHFHNMGSCFYFNFNDTTPRFFYNITTGQSFQNTTSPRYHNLNESNIDSIKLFSPIDYINLYVSAEYLESNYKKIKELRIVYPNINIIPNSYTQDISVESYNLQQFSKQNMLQYITQYIPTHLQDLYKSFL